MAPPPSHHRLRPADVFRVGSAGLRTRPLRAFLSALGIAIGIAAMIAVVGISASGRLQLDRQLAALGTGLLTVTAGTGIDGEEIPLPVESVSMIDRIPGVDRAAAIGRLPDAKVYRTDLIPEEQSGGMSVYAAELGVAATVGAGLAEGTWLNAALAEYPAVVLGARAAERLGIAHARHEVSVLIGGEWFTVVGILRPAPLAPELDTAALVGWQAAQRHLGFDGHPTVVYTRSSDEDVTEVRELLPATANPQEPGAVLVSRPSDALAARQATDEAFTALLLGLGGVALLVGGVGVANTMVISVLERRSEVGLRRSLGATRGQIRLQFSAESVLLSLLGGVGGVLLGTAVTAAYATLQDWPVAVPPWATVGSAVATVLIGVIAGLYPAIRAARLSPTEALATT